MREEMQRFLDKVTEWLLVASESLSEEYFQLPVAGEEPQYRERVYCYELYHLWRQNWSDGFPFSLSGEVDKEKHPIIRRKVKPDFLVHIPGQMTNLLVMEVKPKPKPGIDVPYYAKEVTEILDDLEKLTWFRRELAEYGPNANYFAAFMWFYGLNVEEWPTLRECLRVRIEDQRIDPMLIRYFLHQQFGERPREVYWHI
jgi:hypothetical protein